MPTPLTPERARRLRRNLLAVLGVIALAFGGFWIWTCGLAGGLVGFREAGEIAADNLTRQGAWALIIIAGILGLAWIWVLGVATMSVWTGWRGIAAFAVAVVFNREVPFASLVLAALVTWRLTRIASDTTAVAQATSPATAARPRGRGGDAIVLALGVLLFGLPIAAGIFTAAVVWTQAPTSEWHWAARAPLAIVLGGVTHKIASVVLVMLFGAVARRR
jgi:hypothetical protein